MAEKKDVKKVGKVEKKDEPKVQAEPIDYIVIDGSEPVAKPIGKE